MKRQKEFLGYIIEDGKIYPNAAKVNAVMKFPVPTNIKQLESFLGLAGYLRKFVPDFSRIAKPLSDFTKGNVKFEIGETQVNAFNNLKKKLCDAPVLSFLNQSYETELHTDASIDGYGAILMQKLPDDGQLHPVYYMSKKTSDAERKYSSYELEILAVVEALKKFRVYLLGINFKIVTDCNAFTKTMEKKDLCTRVARWILLLQEFNYKVEHRSGSRMRHVDFLSRHPVMTITEDGVIVRLRRSQLNDEELKRIIEKLKETHTYDGYIMKNGILHKLIDDNELMVVPKLMQREMIRKAHEKGHFAVKKVKEILRREYYMSDMDSKIQNHIDNCVQCIVVNRKRGKQEGELYPLQKNAEPLHTYHVDHLGPLESTNKNYKHIFVVVDSFTKFCWLYPTRSTTATKVISKLQDQSSVFGNPVRIISYRGSAFTSEEFRQYCESENINHILITTGLPRANGQVERMNSVITSVLAKLSADDPSKWYRYLDKVQQAMNSTYSRSIKTTPFELLVGVKMRTPEHLYIRELIDEEVIQ